MRRTAAVAAGVWLAIDLLRVWAPSLITIFGQAASTPAELMGAFALAVVLAGLVPLLLLRLPGVHGRVVLAVTLVLTLGCRVALQVLGGDSPQLWWSSVGVASAVAFCCLATRWLGDRLLEGYAVGLALACTSHAALGTWGAVWRDDGWSTGLLVAQAALVVLALARGTGGRVSPVTRSLAFALLPSLLLAGTWAANPARGSVVDSTWGPVLVVAGSVAAVVVARAGVWRRGTTAVAGVLLIGGTAAVMMPQSASAWSLPAFALGAPALILVLAGLGSGTPDPRPRAPIFAAAGGAVVWVVLFFAYYAGYDLGYRADWVLVLLAAALGAGAVREAPLHDRARGAEEHARAAPASLVASSLVALVLAGLAPTVTVPRVEAQGRQHDGLRVLAWNLRMGYGMDGTFEPREVAAMIAREDPDVVLLSEVDRAWLLNGGQDQLAILARMLDMDAHFGPAADPVWGDAVLTDLPVSDVDAHPLPSYDAVTGAQALALTVELDGVAYDVVSTHVQPHGGDGDGALQQARDLAALAKRRAESGNPVVLGGDFNLEPGDPSWQVLIDSGLEDALDAARPVPTSPADRPEEEIDHVFVSSGLAATEARALPTELSDHLPVVVTVRPAR